MHLRLAVVAALALLLFACTEEDEPLSDPVAEAAEDRARTERVGGNLYRRYCALCHGRDGEGYAADNAPMLSNQEWLRSASDEFITAAIADGRPGTPMSAWSERHGGPLDDGQIDAILQHLRAWQRHPQASVDDIEVVGTPRAGRVLYAIRCARCHGARGEGIDAIALGNPALLSTASAGFLQYAINHGRSGTRMPAFASELEPSQVNDLVMYIRTFADDEASPVAHEGEGESVQAPSLEELALVINPDGDRFEPELRAERFVPADDVQAAIARGARVILIDARATSDWLHQRIPGSIPMPFYEMDDIVERLPRDGTAIVAYCACPHAASGRVVDALRGRGFTNTAVLDEGIQYWVDQGYPTSSGPEQP